MKEELPIDRLLPEVVSSLQHHRSLVLRAPPGTGKTTRVPPALLESGLAGTGQILVLEPRRLAARLSARRVAEELGETLGETIGYQVRLEDVSGPRTRVRFLTEGILTRRIAEDPSLRKVAVVILDEFHERHLHTDLALALLRNLQQRERPDLRLVVLSATLETEPLARYLGDCPVLDAQGKRFEVALEYQEEADDRPLEKQVVSAARKLVRQGLDGDVLVFLPGAAEIRKAREALTPLAEEARLLVSVLHGDLPLAEQDRVLRPADRRKIVLSTNVAETSITVEGVVAVIDSGLARYAGQAPWSGLPVLKVGKISKASATQRAGRAGRTRPGRCLRLYSRRDHDARPEHAVPELQRADLAEPVLVLRSLGVQNVETFGWFEPPPGASIAAADSLLRALEAVDTEGRIAKEGEALLRFPVHPRLGKMLREAHRRGVLPEVASIVALLNERSLSLPTGVLGRAGASDEPTRSSDLLASLDLFDEAQALRFDVDQLRWAGIDAQAARSADRLRKHLLRCAPEYPATNRQQEPDRQDALLRCVLCGYPDRVARRLRARELALAAGGTATLSEASVVREAEFLVAVDAEERQEGRGRRVVVRVASGIRPDWLLELFPQAVQESRKVEWNAVRERVEVIERLQYGALVLDESRDFSTPGEETSQVLWEAAAAVGPQAFAKSDELDRWLARVEFVTARVPSAGLPVLGEEEAREALRSLCQGRLSFEELRQVGLLHGLQQKLLPAQRDALARLAPDRVRLPGGREVKIHYERGKDPWIESRLQDFFGLEQGPHIGGGAVPLVLHLLAPNRRAVQVTRDLSGFWERHYAGIRKELCRKYPKHAWPEDPRRQ